MPRSRTVVLSSVTFIALLAGARAAMPWMVESYVDDRLAGLGEYSGSVDNVDLALLRGAYVLHGLRIDKLGSAEEPFADLPRTDISLQWSGLLDAELVGELRMQGPVLHLIQAETDEETQLGTGVNWPETVRQFFPFRFNIVEVRDGAVTFRAPGIDAEESLTVRSLNVRLHDLTNVQERRNAAFANVEAEGLVMGDAPIRISGRLEPNESLPTFDIDMSIEGAELVAVNPWLREFVNVDAQRGAFSMYAEIAAAQGRFEGYLKPIIENPEIFDLQEEAAGPFQKAWEALVEVGTNLFKNKAEDQVATEIPFSGVLENPEADMLATVANLLRNAFVSAFSHSLEGSIGLDDVQVGASAEGSDEEDLEEAGKEGREEAGEENSGGDADER